MNEIANIKMNAISRVNTVNKIGDQPAHVKDTWE